MSTQISWADETWTVVTGCSKVSAGCKNCYAERLAPRLAAMGKAGYTSLPWTARNAAENVKLRPERLEEPLRWRKPRRVFVTSMGDLFHPLVPFDFVDRVFAVMALAPRHTFQILTKRPERMAEYLSPETWPERTLAVLDAMKEWVGRGAPYAGKGLTGHLADKETLLVPPNVWLGTSVEDQKSADERIPHLLRCPATVRFLSCEPLLGPVDLFGDHENPGPAVSIEGYSYPTDYGTGVEYDAALQPQIDWIIAGGESGPHHRPMKPEWARNLKDQCVAFGVPFFFKQSSGFRNEMDPYLDGEEWHQFPEAEAEA